LLREDFRLIVAQSKKQEVYLDALRWLGNVGSHDGIVDFDDLLSCFEMLEHAMVELLEGREEKRRAEANRIIAAKGKPDLRR
jgi:hypothetical protein